MSTLTGRRKPRRGDDDETRFWLQVRSDRQGCWEWTGCKNASGYGLISVGGRSILAHRFMWSLLYGAVGATHILHRCDNPACVRHDHLFSGTHADNMKDRSRKNRSGLARLSQEQVLALKAEFDAIPLQGRRKARGSLTVMAIKYGVSVGQVQKIGRGVQWKHLQETSK